MGGLDFLGVAALRGVGIILVSVLFGVIVLVVVVSGGVG